MTNHHDTTAPGKFSARLPAAQGFFLVSLCLGGFLFFSSIALAQRAEPVFSDSGPEAEAEAYGKAENYPTGTMIGRPQRFLVGNFTAPPKPSRLVARAESAWAFKRADREVEVSYSRRGYRFSSVADYLSRHPATGLLILKDDTILFEHYQYARRDSDRFASQSMAKTVIAMLIGVAAGEGLIRSLDEPVETYLPGLKGKEYGRTPIRALLHMASGVRFREDYGGEDDIAKLFRGLREMQPNGHAGLIGRFNDRATPPDTKFAYASVETEILGLVLTKATGRPVADYLAEKIWRQIGTESDAHWMTDAAGQEISFCCLYATLRDYARLGRLLAHDGEWNGKQIVPRQWVVDATTVKPGDTFLAPRTATPFFGYGYQTWIFPGERRMFALLGVHGQRIYVDPKSKLVMVQTAVRKAPSNDPSDTDTVGLWMALVDKLGKD